MTITARLVCLLFTVVAVGCDRTADHTDAAGSTKPSEPLIHLTELATDENDRRVAVLLHGYGSDEFDLIPLARRVGLEGRIESFVGPHEVGSGHGWFPIDFESDGVRYPPDAADDVVARLAASLRELRSTHEGRELVVLGFSQGAMLTMLLAAEHPTTLDRGIALSGALPRDPRPASGPHPPLFIAHGTSDRVVPTDRGRRAARLLRAAGVPVSFHEYEGLDHRIDKRVLNDAREWLADDGRR
jgi:phospholipase/carboxylesterase